MIHQKDTVTGVLLLRAREAALGAPADHTATGVAKDLAHTKSRQRESTIVEARKAHAVGYNFGRNEHLREVKAGVLVVVSAFSWD